MGIVILQFVFLKYQQIGAAGAVVMILCALFIGITFTQSGLDKAFNFKVNLDYFRTQFSKSVLARMSGILLVVITIFECVSGLLSLTGIVLFLCGESVLFVTGGLIMSAFTLVCLLFGQRMAKDYVGAASITGYFLVALIGVLACGVATW